ncbi:MAG: RMD1 family protein [Patescibacteria group bacterium]
MATKNKQIKYAKYQAETMYVGESIDLKRVQEGVKQYSYLNRDDPLVIKLLKEQYVVLTKFGTVTFWNVSAHLRKQFLGEIRSYVKSKKEHYPYDEDTKVLIGGGAEKVTFEKVYSAHLSVEKIKIISYVLSQSVALERYEDDIESNLSDFEIVVDNLKTKGKALFSEKKLLKQIGRVFSVKQTTVVHLALFDKPESIWESPDLEILYNKMSSEYDLKIRFDILDKKIGYLSDISKMMMEFLAEKRNAFLETVIIILIIIEIGLWFLPPFSQVLVYLSKFF